MLKQRVKSDQDFANSLLNKDFETIFEKYFPALGKYSQLLVYQQSAEDIVQDILVYIWENQNTIDIHTSPETYLFRAVYQRCISQIKQQNIRTKHRSQVELNLRQAELAYFDSDQNEAIRKLFMNDLSRELNNVIDSLPPRCREVFELSFLQDQQYKEISEKPNISLRRCIRPIAGATATIL